MFLGGGDIAGRGAEVERGKGTIIGDARPPGEGPGIGGAEGKCGGAGASVEVPEEEEGTADDDDDEGKAKEEDESDDDEGMEMVADFLRGCNGKPVADDDDDDEVEVEEEEEEFEEEEIDDDDEEACLSADIRLAMLRTVEGNAASSRFACSPTAVLAAAIGAPAAAAATEPAVEAKLLPRPVATVIEGSVVCERPAAPMVLIIAAAGAAAAGPNVAGEAPDAGAGLSVGGEKNELESIARERRSGANGLVREE